MAMTQIPLTLRIGVTGHRSLDNEQLICDSIRKVLGRLDDRLGKEFPGSPHTFVVISPLAEGSDRLVAREVLNWKKAEGRLSPVLEAILPMPEDLYIKDFKAPGSVEEYSRLKAHAITTIKLDYQGDRHKAFEDAGRYIVQNSDILIAIWNGKPAAGPGGTADVIEYAEKIGRPAIVIDSASGEFMGNIDWENLVKTMHGLYKL